MALASRACFLSEAAARQLGSVSLKGPALVYTDTGVEGASSGPRGSRAGRKNSLQGFL